MWAAAECALAYRRGENSDDAMIGALIETEFHLLVIDALRKK